MVLLMSGAQTKQEKQVKKAANPGAEDQEMKKALFFKISKTTIIISY